MFSKTHQIMFPDQQLCKSHVVFFYSEYFFALNRMHSFFTICYYYLFTYHYSTTVGPQRSHTYFFPRIELEYNFDSSFVLQYTMFEECLLGPTHVGVHCNCLPGVHSAAQRYLVESPGKIRALLEVQHKLGPTRRRALSRVDYTGVWLDVQSPKLECVCVCRRLRRPTKISQGCQSNLELAD